VHELRPGKETSVRLHVTAEVRAALLAQLNKDTAFLETLGVSDYALAVTIALANASGQCGIMLASSMPTLPSVPAPSDPVPLAISASVGSVGSTPDTSSLSASPSEGRMPRSVFFAQTKATKTNRSNSESLPQLLPPSLPRPVLKYRPEKGYRPPPRLQQDSPPMSRALEPPGEERSAFRRDSGGLASAPAAARPEIYMLSVVDILRRAERKKFGVLSGRRDSRASDYSRRFVEHVASILVQ
jgi:hypothetical protein